jgi:hypothetical protein
MFHERQGHLSPPETLLASEGGLFSMGVVKIEDTTKSGAIVFLAAW